MRDILKSLVDIIAEDSTPKEIAETIKGVSTFVGAMEVREYPADTIVCHENALEDTFYIIASGRVHITKQIIEDAPKQFLEERSRGEFFGEMALILDKPRTAEVRTVDQSTMLEINRRAFYEVVEHSPVLEDLFSAETIRNLDNHRVKETMSIKAIQDSQNPVQIFTSYSRHDETRVRQLIDELQQGFSSSNIKIWIDQENIRAGATWFKVVEKALTESQAMLLILSQNAVDSENVQDEWNFYREEQKPIIPVVIDSCRIPYQLRRYQHVNFTEDNRKIALARIHASLLDILPVT